MSQALSAYYGIYDISDNGIRNNVIQILKDLGFIRIQESVFCGSLSTQQKKDLIADVKKIIVKDTDSFLLVLSCKQCFRKVVSLGKTMDLDLIVNNDEAIVF
ncbi:MAG: CRISPR-associated endonuclease Cas2 [Candidatus Nitrosocosmicus sp.]